MVVHTVINWVFYLYQTLIFVYIILSWLPQARSSPIGELLARICEPYLSIFRRFIPPLGGMIDLSPIVALIVLHLVGIGVHTVADFVLGWFL